METSPKVYFPEKMSKSEADIIAESRLTKDNVHRVFNNCCKKSVDTEIRRCYFTNNTWLDQNEVDNNSEIIATFLEQLPEDFFNKSSCGYDYRFARWTKGTPRKKFDEFIKKSERKQKKEPLEGAWTDNCSELLDLAIVAGMGKINRMQGESTPRELRFANFLCTIEQGEKEIASRNLLKGKY